MPYGNYIPLINKYLDQFDYTVPTILEIGVEYGGMTLPLLTHLVNKDSPFMYVGVDIDLKKEMLDGVQNIIDSRIGGNEDRCYKHELGTNIKFYQNNSLDKLPQIIDDNWSFDLILVDGDHNYHTVSKELSYIDKLRRRHSLIIVDDMYGPWATADFFYSEDDENAKNNPLATPRTKSRKHGVRPAVFEWLAKNTDLELWSLNMVDGEEKLEHIKPGDEGFIHVCHGVLIKPKSLNLAGII